MEQKKISRRDFIKAAGFLSTASLLAACAPQVVTQVVNQTQLVPQTQIVQQTSVVKETQIVNQVVTATPEPTQVPAPAVMDIWAIVTVADVHAKWDPKDSTNDAFKKEWWTGGMIRAGVLPWLDKHPGVTVKIVGHGWDTGLRQNIYLALAAGITPDTSYGEAYVSEFVSLNLYAPVSDAAKALYPESTYRAALKDGKAYGLAETTGANVLFINLDVLQKVGLDPTKLPTTWDELLAMADTISKGNKGNAYFTYAPHPEGSFIAFRIAHWFSQSNVPLGTDLGVPTFNTPGAADVWLFHNKLLYSSKVDTVLNIDAHGEGKSGSGLSFDAGDIALKAGWNNDATYILSNAKAIEFPIPTGGHKASMLTGNQINSPFKNGPNPELAIDYIESTVGNEEAQIVKPNGCGIWLPTLTSMLSQYATFDKLGGYPEKARDNVRVTMKAALDSGTGPVPGWPKNPTRIWTAWNDSYGKIWKGNLGKDDIQKELDALQKTVEGLLAIAA